MLLLINLWVCSRQCAQVYARGKHFCARDRGFRRTGSFTYECSSRECSQQQEDSGAGVQVHVGEHANPLRSSRHRHRNPPRQTKRHVPTVHTSRCFHLPSLRRHRPRSLHSPQVRHFISHSTHTHNNNNRSILRLLVSPCTDSWSF